MCPYLSDFGSSSTGPKLAMPRAAKPGPTAQRSSTARMVPRVSSGVVVGRRTVSRTSSGPDANTQTHFVPPSSMPAISGSAIPVVMAAPCRVPTGSAMPAFRRHTLGAARFRRHW